MLNRFCDVRRVIASIMMCLFLGGSLTMGNAATVRHYIAVGGSRLYIVDVSESADSISGSFRILSDSGHGTLIERKEPISGALDSTSHFKGVFAGRSSTGVIDDDVASFRFLREHGGETELKFQRATTEQVDKQIQELSDVAKLLWEDSKKP